MFPQKGTIAVGSDADIVIFDPEREVTISRHDPRTHHMNIDYSAYEGFKVRGYTETVLSRGRVVIDQASTSAGRATGGSSSAVPTAGRTRRSPLPRGPPPTSEAPPARSDAHPVGHEPCGSLPRLASGERIR